jgi:hypothetical protein
MGRRGRPESFPYLYGSSRGAVRASNWSARPTWAAIFDANRVYAPHRLDVDAALACFCPECDRKEFGDAPL